MGPVGVLDAESPTSPVDLLTTTVTDTSVTLSWTAASDNVAVTGYRIYRDGLLLFTSSVLVFSDSGLLPATSYLYAVTALDASGNESVSSEIQVTTSAAPVVVVPPAQSSGGGNVSICLLLFLGALLGLSTGRRQLRTLPPENGVQLVSI